MQGVEQNAGLQLPTVSEYDPEVADIIRRDRLKSAKNYPRQCDRCRRQHLVFVAKHLGDKPQRH